MLFSATPRKVLALLALLGLIGVMLVGALTATARAHPSAASSVIVPRVVGQRLDIAQLRLSRAGLRARHACNGLFGCVVLSHWVVCSQSPHAGARVARGYIVFLQADRPGYCGG